MQTILQKVMVDLVHKKLETSGELLHELLQTIDLINHNHYPSWYQDIFFQDGYPKPFSIYDAYIFYWLHAQLGLGKILYAEVLIGEKPSSDKNVNELNKKLQTLWYPFRGAFWGGNKGEDGEIYVDIPIQISVKSYSSLIISKNVSGRFPLEVGTTDIFKTFVYLNTGLKRIARWPYKSEVIYLLSAV